MGGQGQWSHQSPSGWCPPAKCQQAGGGGRLGVGAHSCHLPDPCPWKWCPCLQDSGPWRLTARSLSVADPTHPTCTPHSCSQSPRVGSPTWSTAAPPSSHRFLLSSLGWGLRLGELQTFASWGLAGAAIPGRLGQWWRWGYLWLSNSGVSSPVSREETEIWSICQERPGSTVPLKALGPAAHTAELWARSGSQESPREGGPSGRWVPLRTTPRPLPSARGQDLAPA